MATEDERDRVRRFVREQMRRLEWNERSFELLTGLDSKTASSLLKGTRYPNTPTRTKVEEAMGLALGTLDAVRAGLIDPEPATDVDPVEQAINASALTRSNKLKLAGIYYEMLEAQDQGRAGTA